MGVVWLRWAVVVAAARLGGNLVYGQKIVVEHCVAEKIPNEFTAVLCESDLAEAKSCVPSTT
jgi:hypothetical protein